MPATAQTHGHEILRLVHAADPPLTRPQLIQEARRRFGPAARYHTCSATDLTLDELLAFLTARGKLRERQGHVSADIGQMCANDDPEPH